MNSKKTYEIMVLSFCLVLLGIEFIGISSWFFIEISENPLHVLRETMSRWIIVVLAIFAFALIVAKASFKPRDSELMTASALSALTRNHTRDLAVLALIVVLIPVLLGLYGWMQLTTSAGRASRNAYSLMSLLINLGPILGLTGLVGIGYAGIKSRQAKQ